MRVDEARLVLGLSPNCRPTPSQIKAAYRRKVLETHPDRFPLPQKPQAESQFKLVSQAYAFLNSGRLEQPAKGTYSRVVKTGVPSPQGHRNFGLASVPFILIIIGTFTLGLIQGRKMHILHSTPFFHEIQTNQAAKLFNVVLLLD